MSGVGFRTRLALGQWVIPDRRRRLCSPGLSQALSEGPFSSVVPSAPGLRRFGPYYTEPVIAGLDPKTFKPFICSLDLIGCPMVTDDFVVSGTCSEQMYGMCESLWEPNMVSPGPGGGLGSEVCALGQQGSVVMWRVTRVRSRGGEGAAAAGRGRVSRSPIRRALARAGSGEHASCRETPGRYLLSSESPHRGFTGSWHPCCTDPVPARG